MPAAFTAHTGRDHWEVLLRARAVENQCYVVAAGQIGDHEPGRSCYGRSMVDRSVGDGAGAGTGRCGIASPTSTWTGWPDPRELPTWQPSEPELNRLLYLMMPTAGRRKRVVSVPTASDYPTLGCRRRSPEQLTAIVPRTVIATMRKPVTRAAFVIRAGPRRDEPPHAQDGHDEQATGDQGLPRRVEQAEQRVGRDVGTPATVPRQTRAPC